MDLALEPKYNLSRKIKSEKTLSHIWKENFMRLLAAIYITLFLLPTPAHANQSARASHAPEYTYTQESFCKLMESAASGLNAKGPVWVDNLTRLDRVTVSCSTKIVEFQKSLKVNSDALPSGWQQRMQDQWNQTYCAGYQDPIADGWQIVTAATFPNGEQFRVQPKCN